MDSYPSQKSNSGTRLISWSLALMYLLAIIGIEISLLLDINPGWVIFVYGLMLISLYVLAALKPENSPMLIGLAGIPIIRIVAYGVPYASSTPTVYFGVTGFVLLFYVVAILRMPEFATSHILKFPHNWLIQMPIILSGVAVGFFQFLIHPQKILYFRGPFEFITFIATLVLSAFVEEVMFRGIVLDGFTKRFSSGVGIVFAALVYTSLFIPFGSIELDLVMFITSLFYGFTAVRSSGLYGIIGAHFVSSVFYYLILPAIY